MANANIKLGITTDAEQSIPKQVLIGANRAQKVLNSKPLRLSIDTKDLSKLKDLNKLPLGQFSKDARDFDKSLGAATQRVVAFGAAVGAIYAVEKAFQLLIQTGINVEKQLTDIKVVLGTSDANFKKFAEGLFNVSRLTATSFDEASKAATEFARQGLTVEQTLKRTQDALTLSRITGLDTTESVEKLTAAYNTFSKQLIDTTQIVDKFIAVDTSFAVSSKDLAEGLSRVGNTAQEAKASFDEVVGAITALQQRTARGGAVIGNALKSIFTRVQRSETLDQIEGLGVATKDLEGNIRPALSILDDLADRFKGLGDAQKKQTAEQIAGVYQINQFLALMQDLGSANSIVEQATKKSSQAQGEAAIRTAELNKTTSALISQSLSGFTELAAKISSIALDKPIKSFLGDITAQGSALTSVISSLNKIGTDYEDVGSKIAESILKGIGNILTGPGIAFVGVAVAKVLSRLVVYAKDSLVGLLKVNGAAQQSLQINTAIDNILAGGNDLYKQRYALATSVQQKEQIILELMQAQALAATRTSAVANSFQAGGFRPSPEGGLIQRRGILSRAGGTLGDALSSEINSIRTSPDYAGSRNAKPVIIPNFALGGRSQTIVANTAEKMVPTRSIVSNYSGGDLQTILNPRQQKVLGLAGGSFGISFADINRAKNKQELLQLYKELGGAPQFESRLRKSNIQDTKRILRSIISRQQGSGTARNFGDLPGNLRSQSELANGRANAYILPASQRTLEASRAATAASSIGMGNYGRLALPQGIRQPGLRYEEGSYPTIPLRNGPQYGLPDPSVIKSSRQFINNAASARLYSSAANKTRVGGTFSAREGKAVYAQALKDAIQNSGYSKGEFNSLSGIANDKLADPETRNSAKKIVNTIIGEARGVLKGAITTAADTQSFNRASSALLNVKPSLFGNIDKSVGKALTGIPLTTEVQQLRQEKAAQLRQQRSGSLQTIGLAASFALPAVAGIVDANAGDSFRGRLASSALNGAGVGSAGFLFGPQTGAITTAIGGIGGAANAAINEPKNQALKKLADLQKQRQNKSDNIEKLSRFAQQGPIIQDLVSSGAKSSVIRASLAQRQKDFESITDPTLKSKLNAILGRHLSPEDENDALNEAIDKEGGELRSIEGGKEASARLEVQRQSPLNLIRRKFLDTPFGKLAPRVGPFGIPTVAGLIGNERKIDPNEREGIAAQISGENLFENLTRPQLEALQKGINGGLGGKELLGRKFLPFNDKAKNKFKELGDYGNESQKPILQLAVENAIQNLNLKENQTGKDEGVLNSGEILKKIRRQSRRGSLEDLSNINSFNTQKDLFSNKGSAIIDRFSDSLSEKDKITLQGRFDRAQKQAEITQKSAGDLTQFKQGISGLAPEFSKENLLLNPDVKSSFDKALNASDTTGLSNLFDTLKSKVEGAGGSSDLVEKLEQIKQTIDEANDNLAESKKYQENSLALEKQQLDELSKKNQANLLGGSGVFNASPNSAAINNGIFAGSGFTAATRGLPRGYGPRQLRELNNQAAISSGSSIESAIQETQKSGAFTDDQIFGSSAKSGLFDYETYRKGIQAKREDIFKNQGLGAISSSRLNQIAPDKLYQASQAITKDNDFDSAYKIISSIKTLKPENEQNKQELLNTLSQSTFNFRNSATASKDVADERFKRGGKDAGKSLGEEIDKLPTAIKTAIIDPLKTVLSDSLGPFKDFKASINNVASIVINAEMRGKDELNSAIASIEKTLADYGYKIDTIAKEAKVSFPPSREPNIPSIKTPSISSPNASE